MEAPGWRVRRFVRLSRPTHSSPLTVDGTTNFFFLLFSLPQLSGRVYFSKDLDCFVNGTFRKKIFQKDVVE